MANQVQLAIATNKNSKRVTDVPKSTAKHNTLSKESKKPLQSVIGARKESARNSVIYCVQKLELSSAIGPKHKNQQKMLGMTTKLFS